MDEGKNCAGEPDSAWWHGIPDSVRKCLLTALAAAGDPDGSISDDHGVERADAAEVILAARSVQAWAESVEIAGTQRVLRSVEDDCGIDLGQHEPRSSRDARLREARRAVGGELEQLTGLSSTACRERVALASATRERAGYLRLRMDHGTLSGFRAITVLKETRHLDPLTADRIAAGPGTVGRHAVSSRRRGWAAR